MTFSKALERSEEVPKYNPRVNTAQKIISLAAPGACAPAALHLARRYSLEKLQEILTLLESFQEVVSDGK